MYKKRFVVARFEKGKAPYYSRGWYTFDEAWFLYRNMPLPAKAEVLKKIDDYTAKYYPESVPKEFEKLKHVLGKLLSDPNYPGDEFDVEDFYFDDEMVSITLEDGVLDVSRKEDIPDQSLFPEVLIEVIKAPEHGGNYRFRVDTHDGECHIDLQLFAVDTWEDDIT